nr:DUF6461 domain-containing protein [Rhodococcus qingshengii]
MKVLTHSRDVEAVSSFDLWQNGVHTVKVDPLFSSEAGLNPMSEAWQSRMKEVGLDPNGGGPSTIESPGFESAEATGR